MPMVSFASLLAPEARARAQASNVMADGLTSFFVAEVPGFSVIQLRREPMDCQS